MTPVQRDFLDCLRRLTVRGVAPSFEEMRLHLGYASKSFVHTVMDALERDGLIRYSYHDGYRVARSAVVVEDAVAPSTLSALSDEDLRQTAAHIAGILSARKVGAYATAVAYRNIADHHCKWPISGESDTMLFCGAPVWPETRPYCTAHHAWSRAPQQWVMAA